MQGEELDAAEITAGGLLGDRRFAVIDSATGNLANAKNHRKWPRFYSYRAAYTEPPRAGSALPAVRITTPGGASATTDRAAKGGESHDGEGQRDSSTEHRSKR